MSKTPIDHPENPEWTAEDFANAKPAAELPEAIKAFFPKTRGPQKAPKKVAVSIRLSTEVVDYFKSGGPGWQNRIDEALRKVAGQSTP